MNKYKTLAMLFSGLYAVLSANALLAQIEVNISAAKDNTLYESTTGAFSNGMGAHLFVAQNNHGEVRRTLLAFDVASSIPPGAAILTAKLTLNMSKAFSPAEQSVVLHRVLADWGEGASDAAGEEGGGANATPGDATWIHTFFNMQRWSNAGGDFAPAASATLTVGAAGFYTWDAPAMVADVQAWLNAPANNSGWLLLSNENINGSAKRFDSRENSNISNRPALTVTYTISSSIMEASEAVPTQFALAQNFPNPFSRTHGASTFIHYDLPKPTHVKLEIYDLLGQRVRWLVNTMEVSGYKSVRWDGNNDAGQRVASGIYIYHLETADFTAMRKLTLLHD